VTTSGLIATPSGREDCATDTLGERTVNVQDGTQLLHQGSHADAAIEQPVGDQVRDRIRALAEAARDLSDACADLADELRPLGSGMDDPLTMDFARLRAERAAALLDEAALAARRTLGLLDSASAAASDGWSAPPGDPTAAPASAARPAESLNGTGYEPPGWPAEPAPAGTPDHAPDRATGYEPSGWPAEPAPGATPDHAPERTAGHEPSGWPAEPAPAGTPDHAPDRTAGYEPSGWPPVGAAQASSPGLFPIGPPPGPPAFGASAADRPAMPESTWPDAFVEQPSPRRTTPMAPDDPTPWGSGGENDERDARAAEPPAPNGEWSADAAVDARAADPTAPNGEWSADAAVDARSADPTAPNGEWSPDAAVDTRAAEPPAPNGDRPAHAASVEPEAAAAAGPYADEPAHATQPGTPLLTLVPDPAEHAAAAAEQATPERRADKTHVAELHGTDQVALATVARQVESARRHLQAAVLAAHDQAGHPSLSRLLGAVERVLEAATDLAAGCRESLQADVGSRTFPGEARFVCAVPWERTSVVAPDVGVEPANPAGLARLLRALCYDACAHTGSTGVAGVQVRSDRYAAHVALVEPAGGGRQRWSGALEWVDPRGQRRTWAETLGPVELGEEELARRVDELLRRCVGTAD
jgi:hypothetical protein